MSPICNCDPEIEVPCEHDRRVRSPAPKGPGCSVCGVAGHTGAEQHCSVCRVYPAEHKIGEEGRGELGFQNLTNYLCCTHFSQIVGDCSRLPTYGHRRT